MGMGIIVGLIVIVLIIACVKISNSQNTSSVNNVNFKKFECNYLGGIRGLSFSQPFPIKVYIYTDKITIKCNNLEYIIDYKDIITFDIQTEHSISKDVTITRLLTIGVFAFAFKKKKTNIENYLVLKYKQDNEEMAVIFEGVWIRKINYELRQIYDNYKKINENIYEN